MMTRMKPNRFFRRRHAAGLLTLGLWCFGAAFAFAAPDESPPAPRGGAAARQDVLVRLDGTTVAGKVTGIDASGKVHLRTSAGNKTIALMMLRAIRRTGAPAAPAATRPTSRILVFQGDGGALFARQVAIAQQRCNLHWRYGQLSLPLTHLRGVYLPPPKADIRHQTSEIRNSKGFLSDLRATQPVREDRVYVKTDKGVQRVDCLIQSLDDAAVTVRWQGKTRRIARSRLVGILFAQLAAPGDRTGQCRVTMADGSSLWGTLTSLDDGKLHLRFDSAASGGTPPQSGGAFKEILLPWDQVASVTVRSDRMVFLSDLKPVRIEQSSFLDFHWPWRLDRSVMDQPITLAGQRYDKGLGVHARCRLTYTNAGYDRFAAVIGLQDSTDTVGDCQFQVIGDGKVLYEARVRRGDGPRPRKVDVDIRGVRELTLAVEPGEDMDFGDRADWADARLIKGDEGG